MTLGLTQGQDFSGHYTLLQRISQGSSVENWLALDKASSERVMLRVFCAALPDAERHRIERTVATGRGLVHPGIARIYGLEHAGGLDYLVCQYVRARAHFIPAQANFTGQWPVLVELLDTLSFAHSLGVAHGHLHPGNLLLDDTNRLHITEFGVPPGISGEAAYRDWLSPQVLQGQAPDPSDDVYSLGYLLYVGLTGRQWSRDEGFRTDSPIPHEVGRLVTTMLAASAYDRPRDLSHVRDILKRYLVGESDLPLENLGGFTRPIEARDLPFSSNGVASPREGRLMSAPVAFAGFALLTVLAGIVFFLLPRLTQMDIASPQHAESSQTATPTAARQAQAPPTLTPLEIARRKQLEHEGNSIATQFLQLQVVLENAGVQLWAPDTYERAQTLSADGDEAYRHSRFQQALDFYKQGVSVLEDLKSKIATVKSDNLQRGSMALAKGNYHAAIEAFRIVTAIDPDDAAAHQDLQRAENLHQVLALVKDGRYLQHEGKLDEARRKFVAAQKLDPQWQAAKKGLQQVNERITRRRFDDTMSVAFTALGNHQYGKARAEFQRARRILPGATGPGDGLEQVRVAIRQDEIETGRQAAQTAIADENWPAVISVYEKVLALDPSLVFANRGLERAKARLALQRQMHRLITDPALMASNDELAFAKQLLVRASTAQSAGPHLQAQMDQLSQLIALARIPVTVQLKSDDHTDVTVYHVGHLGKLESTFIKLIPGTYTIVGQRDGYRDVQRKLTVVGGEQVKPVYISCTDKI